MNFFIYYLSFILIVLLAYLFILYFLFSLLYIDYTEKFILGYNRINSLRLNLSRAVTILSNLK